MTFRKRKITVPRTLGKRLKEARLKKGVTLEQVEHATKIRLKYLEAVEKDNFKKLPSTVYAQGFVARYAEFLGIAKKEALDQFKAEGGKIFAPPAKLAPEGNVRELKFTFTPQTLLVIVLGVLVVALLIYIGAQVKKFSAPPFIDVQTSEEVVASPELILRGKTLPYARLTLNGELLSLDDQGNFSELVNLQPGLNTLELIAQNRAGKQTKRVVKVFYEAPASKEPAAPPSNPPPAGQSTGVPQNRFRLDATSIG